MSRLGLFEGVGVELEYMIVDSDRLDVRPIADRLMAHIAGGPETEVDLGPAAWSNELVLHVLEMKTNGPAPELAGLGEMFREHVARANGLLGAWGARLLPGGMHPWMDPATETRLWPHEYNEVYRTFDRIFGCAGHGWANLQSTHLNLPWADDVEFRALHAAVRAVLPLVPGLAAASPVHDGLRAAALDARVVAYRGNALRVPSVTGAVVPEVARSRAEYETGILSRIYEDLKDLDPAGVLRHEWVNARGAIARFDRGTIEIRLVDAQEGPLADLAVTAAIHGAVKRLTLSPPEGLDGLEALETSRLSAHLDETARRGDEGVIRDAGYLRALGLRRAQARAGEIWARLIDDGVGREAGSGEWAAHLETILRHGCLARRIVAALGDAPGRAALHRVWSDLAEAMESTEPFTPAAARPAVGQAVPGSPA